MATAVQSTILDAGGRPFVRPRQYWAGGMDAGQVGRRLRSLPTATRAINSQIRQYGPTIVARSRYLAINNPYASMAREAYVSALVGSGITPSPQVTDLTLRSALKDAWDDWTDEADADFLTNFYGLQSIIAGEMFEAGECFVRLHQQQSDTMISPVPLQLQLLPSEMCPVGKNTALENGRRIECGIEFDEAGRRVAYHFYRAHPGTDQNFGVPQWDTVRVPADEVLHLYKPIRAGQLRGIPHTLAAIAALAIMDLYDDAELERKRIAALFTAFITRPAPDAQDPVYGQPQNLVLPDTSGIPQQPVVTDAPVMEPGATVELDPGEEVKFSEPADVGAHYEPFQYRALLRIAAGFGVPYAEMTGDLKQANYGSIRAGLITFRRRVTATQHQIMVFQLCRPVWARFLREAVLAQALPLSPAAFLSQRRQLMRVKWQPPAWEWIDPWKDLKAEEVAVANRFKPRSYTVEEGGYDKEEVDKTIAEDQKRLQDAEVSLVQPLPSREEFPVPAGGTVFDTGTGEEPPGAPTPEPPAQARAEDPDFLTHLQEIDR